MNFATTFLGKFLPSSETDQQIATAHEAIAQHVAKIDMRWSKCDISHVEIGPHWAEICPGVRQVECQLPTTACTLLNVVLDPGAAIPRHNHESARETIFVVEGEILDGETGIITGTNGVYVIPVGRHHTISTTRGALVNVLFHPKIVPSIQ